MQIINVDLTLSSDLNFSDVYIEEKDVLWRLNLGLEDEIMRSSMYESLVCGVGHFLTFLENYEGESLHIISLFQGTYANLIKSMNLLEKITHSCFCPYPLIIEVKDKALPLEDLVSLHIWKSKSPPLQLSFSDPQISSDYQTDKEIKKVNCPIALLVPENHTSDYIIQALEQIEERPVKLVPEVLFSMEWDELDRIYRPKGLLTQDTERLLLGFSVTGVDIVTFLSERSSIG